MNGKDELLAQIDLAVASTPSGGQIEFRVERARWRVENTVEALAAFRVRVVRRWLNSAPPKARPRRAPAGVVGSALSFLADGELMNAFNLLSLSGTRYVLSDGGNCVNINVVCSSFIYADTELCVVVHLAAGTQRAMQDVPMVKRYGVIEPISGLFITQRQKTTPAAKVAAIARVDSVGAAALHDVVASRRGPTDADFLRAHGGGE